MTGLVEFIKEVDSGTLLTTVPSGGRYPLVGDTA